MFGKKQTSSGDGAPAPIDGTSGAFEYVTTIKTGQRYRDTVSGIEGKLVSVTFTEHGPARGVLKYMNREGLMSSAGIDAPSLEPTEPDATVGQFAYRSDLEIGEKYTVDDYGIEGTITIIQFHLYSCEHGYIRRIEERSGDVTEDGFDAAEFTRADTRERVPVGRPGGPPLGASASRLR